MKRIIHLNLEVTLSSEFDLEKAVCNHGQFMMPPNQWIPFSKTLQRPLRLYDSNYSVLVSIKQTSSFLLTIQIHSSSPPPPCSSTHHHRLSLQDEQAILDQVVRMLRLTEKDEDELKKFQSLHPRAKQMGFGRLFRSPSLFEDALKSILLCNTTWKRTLAMAGQLCKLQAKMSSENNNNNKNISTRKRKRSSNNKGAGKSEKVVVIGNFPNAEEICRMGVELLKEHSLGYRAGFIVNFAQHVKNGKIDLQTLEFQNPSYYFPKIKGFGPFATANLLMCLGFYRQLPIDTETIRHLKQVHGIQFCNNKTVREDVKLIYDKYAPFQCLAYWLELVEFYESKFGKLSELCSLDYHKISGTTLKL